MIQVNNNSNCVAIFQSSTWQQQKELFDKLKELQIYVYLYSEFAQITTSGIRTIKVPKKCLKSFEIFSEWVINKGVKMWNY